MSYCFGCEKLMREYEKRTGTYYRCGKNGRTLAYRKKDIKLPRDAISKPAWCKEGKGWELKSVDLRGKRADE